MELQLELGLGQGRGRGKGRVKFFFQSRAEGYTNLVENAFEGVGYFCGLAKPA